MRSSKTIILNHANYAKQCTLWEAFIMISKQTVKQIWFWKASMWHEIKQEAQSAYNIDEAHAVPGEDQKQKNYELNIWET